MIGDDEGSIFLTLSDYPVLRSYLIVTYSSEGQLVRTGSGRFSDASHALPLPQRRGFQMLEGDVLNAPDLATYAADGAVVSRFRLAPADSMVSSTDISGGSLVEAFANFFNGDLSKYPWTLSARRFDSSGRPHANARVFATDSAGDTIVGNLAGGVTITGWTFVVWTTVARPDMAQLSGDLVGAWIGPDGAVSAPAPWS